jgi:NADH-quinone oxidoreductase subunit K
MTGATTAAAPVAQGFQVLAVPLDWYLALSAVLFCIGLVGVLTRRNVLVIFMSVELMMNAVNLTLVAFGASLGTLAGQAFVVFVVTVAAAEAAVGLAIIMAYVRQKPTIDPVEMNLMKE